MKEVLNSRRSSQKSALKTPEAQISFHSCKLSKKSKKRQAKCDLCTRLNLVKFVIEKDKRKQEERTKRREERKKKQHEQQQRQQEIKEMEKVQRANRFKILEMGQEEKEEFLKSREASPTIKASSKRIRNVTVNKDLKSQISGITNSQIFEDSRKPNKKFLHALDKKRKKIDTYQHTFINEYSENASNLQSSKKVIESPMVPLSRLDYHNASSSNKRVIKLKSASKIKLKNRPNLNSRLSKIKEDQRIFEEKQNARKILIKNRISSMKKFRSAQANKSLTLSRTKREFSKPRLHITAFDFKPRSQSRSGAYGNFASQQNKDLNDSSYQLNVNFTKKHSLNSEGFLQTTRNICNSVNSEEDAKFYSRLSTRHQKIRKKNREMSLKVHSAIKQHQEMDLKLINNQRFETLIRDTALKENDSDDGF